MRDRRVRARRHHRQDHARTAFSYVADGALGRLRRRSRSRPVPHLHGARARLLEAAEQTQKLTPARAVETADTDDLALVHLEIDVSYAHAAELLGAYDHGSVGY